MDNAEWHLVAHMVQQDQRKKLAEYMQSRTRVPYFIGYVLGFIRPLLQLHSKSDKAIEVSTSLTK